jgi:hypothetical protein
MNKRDLYRDAKAALAEASRLEEGIKASGQQLNAARWRLAEDMGQLYELGETQTAIRTELGVSQSTVSRYLKIWQEYGGYSARNRPDFGDALKEIRGGDWDHDPVTPEKRAERAAGYLRDRDVWRDDSVQEVMRAQVRKDIREQSRPSAPKATAGGTNLTVITRTYWEITLAKMIEASRVIRESIGELDRSGMPNVQSGAIIRQARTLAAAAQELEHRLSETAVGRSAS